MRILSKMTLAALAVLIPTSFAACSNGGDEEDMGGADGSGGNDTDGSGGNDTDGSGGNDTDGSGGNDTDGSGGNDVGGQGGMGGGSGGAGPSEPPFVAADCWAPGGPNAAVTGSGIGAFRESADWMDGWTNWSVNSTPEDDGTAATDQLEGDIDADMTLDASKIYELVDIVHVLDGVTLTIPAGTLFKSTGTGTLVVSRGGRLVAEGTAEAPIVFTSQAANGVKGPGQWGGVVILGNASNFTGPNVDIEGLASDELNQHGPGGDDEDPNDPIDDQDSGVLEYVRIEFGGTELADGAEINGLTMGSVGSGTTISHVQVNTTWDDGFEWFGGSVVGDHLVVNNEGDDMFDIDTGYVGELEYLFGRQVATVKADPNGFEWDGSEADLEPQTNPTVSHVTLCGVPDGKPNYGMVLREHVQAEADDVAFLGFDFGIDLRDAVSDDLLLTNSISWSHFGGIENVAVEPGDAALADDKVEAEWFAEQEGNVDFDAE